MNHAADLSNIRPASDQNHPSRLALFGPPTSGAHLHWNPNRLFRADSHHSGTGCEAPTPRTVQRPLCLG